MRDVIAYAPGRTELAGNHTDHQGGRVIAATLDCGVRMRLHANESDHVHLESDGFGPVDLSLADESAVADERLQTAALVRGVAASMRAYGVPVSGFDACVESTVPAGGGLSSSAAFELALAAGLNLMFGGSLSPVELAKVGQAAERDWFGKPCGLMDQLSIAFGGTNLFDFGEPVRVGGGATLSRSDSPRFVESATGAFESLRNSLGEGSPATSPASCSPSGGAGEAGETLWTPSSPFLGEERSARAEGEVAERDVSKASPAKQCVGESLSTCSPAVREDTQSLRQSSLAAARCGTRFVGTLPHDGLHDENSLCEGSPTTSPADCPHDGLQGQEAAATTPRVERMELDLAGQGYALCLVDTHCDHSIYTDEYARVASDMGDVAHFLGFETLSQVGFDTLAARFGDVRAQLGDLPALRALHYFNEMRLVDERACALRRGDFEAFLEATRLSGASSAQFLQNVSTFDRNSQPAMVALALATVLLEGRGAARIHGGGFGGSIQAFVPCEMVERFSKAIDEQLSAGSCRVYMIVSEGAGAQWA